MNPGDLGQLQSAVQQLLSEDSFAWLTQKRWFADKGNTISGIEIVELTETTLASVTVLLTIVDVELQDSGHARYFVPLLVEAPSGEQDGLAENDCDRPALVDAVTLPSFGRWLAELLSTGGNLPASGAWAVNSTPTTPARFHSPNTINSRAIGGEQSNSSLRVGDGVVVKILRRVQPGVNPEDEILQALSGSKKARVSSYLGSLYWRAEHGQQFTAAIAQQWVPNRGDGWTWILEHLRRAGIEGSVDPIAISAMRVLGRRTAELHLALAAAEDDAFRKRAATAEDVVQVQAAFHASLERSIALATDSAAGLPDDLVAKLPLVLAAMADLERLARGFAEEEGAARIRVHGDYHLGQVLRTTDKDWTIIDFEGEPARSLAERRMRSSPLRDVAGMLRSFAYARAVAEQGLVAGDRDGDLAQVILRHWEEQAREALVEGYRTALDSHARDVAMPLVPQSDAAFELALAAWEADKALYEVAYEARNRPEWIGIPLQALAPELFNQA